MPVPSPRDVLDLANQIVAAEDHLAALRSKWESLLGITSVQPSEPRNVGGRPSRSNSVASQVLAAVNEDPTLHWDAEGMSRHLNADRSAVASALYNLHVAKKIARHSRGNYESLINSDANQMETSDREEAA